MWVFEKNIGIGKYCMGNTDDDLFQLTFLYMKRRLLRFYPLVSDLFIGHCFQKLIRTDGNLAFIGNNDVKMGISQGLKIVFLSKWLIFRNFISYNCFIVNLEREWQFKVSFLWNFTQRYKILYWQEILKKKIGLACYILF